VPEPGRTSCCSSPGSWRQATDLAIRRAITRLGLTFPLILGYDVSAWCRHRRRRHRWAGVSGARCGGRRHDHRAVPGTRSTTVPNVDDRSPIHSRCHMWRRRFVSPPRRLRVRSISRPLTTRPAATRRGPACGGRFACRLQTSLRAGNRGSPQARIEWCGRWVPRTCLTATRFDRRTRQARGRRHTTQSGRTASGGRVLQNGPDGGVM